MKIDANIYRNSKKHAMKSKSTIKNLHGFTLVELMIVVLLTGIAVIAIYRGYTSFSHSADVQEQIIEMQQNLRVGMYWLEKDLRRAEMNEEEDITAGFTLADIDTVEFTMDLGGTNFNAYDDIKPCTGNPEGDGDVLDSCEMITYARLDPDGDEVFGLYRNDENESPGTAGDQIISNLEALRFVYLDEDGNTIDPDPAVGTELSNEQRANIRSVEISMIVRTTNEDYRYTNNESYENTIPVGGSLVQVLAPQNDNFRRRILSKVIKIRNAGL
jgi:prepilin-type N-terminal cleavage/methylation domain-containing protein